LILITTSICGVCDCPAGVPFSFEALFALLDVFLPAVRADE